MLSRRQDFAPLIPGILSLRFYSDTHRTGMGTERVRFSRLCDDTEAISPDRLSDETDDGLEYWPLKQLSQEAITEFDSVKTQEHFEVRDLILM